MATKTKFNAAARKLGDSGQSQSSNAANWLKNKWAAIVNWVQGRPVSLWLNLGLLLIIIIIFTILLGHFHDKREIESGTNGSAIFNTATAQTDPFIMPDNNAAPKDDAELRQAVIARRASEKSEPVAPIVVDAPKQLGGDVIIDGEEFGSRNRLGQCDKISGNLILQNMHKYTLPCGIVVDGDLIIRNLGLVRFCGEFTITGNIRVAPRSSFGPLPSNARLGGQVIL
ncbi:MAG: hypothetical protein LBO08_01140 [Rickettsiales bacterium]|jgi:hypothetical protein|nr:hypothetical protein [Rickettsiales bacterium]